MPVKNFKDDHSAVHDLATDFYFEVTRLGRRNLMVDEDDIDMTRFRIGCRLCGLFRSGRVALRDLPLGSQRQVGILLVFKLRFLRIPCLYDPFHEVAHFLPLAHAHVGRRIKFSALLYERAHDLIAQRFRQLTQFGHRCL